MSDYSFVMSDKTLNEFREFMRTDKDVLEIVDVDYEEVSSELLTQLDDEI